MFKAIEADTRVMGKNINLSQKNVILLWIKSYNPHTNPVKKIRKDPAPKNLINISA